MKPSWVNIGAADIKVRGPVAEISPLTQITVTQCLQVMLLFGIGGIEVGYTGIVGALSPVTYDLDIKVVKRPECLEVRKKIVCLHWAHLLCAAGLARLEMNPTSEDIAKTIEAWTNIHKQEGSENA